VKRKVLITGAGGFIGSHLWHGLNSQSHEVLACVTSSPEGVRLPPGRIFSFRIPNEDLWHLLARERPDFIVHCAGGSSIAKSLAAPESDFKNNVIATESLLQAVAANSPQTRVIFISSAAVYGNPAEVPARESTPPAPISPYGFHKLLAELICQKYYQLSHVPTTVLRVFSVFGPGLKKQVLWDIYHQWLSSENISLSGSGEETRDLMYVDDLVRVVQLVIERSDFRAETLNVATGREVSIRQIAAFMLDALGNRKPVCFTGKTRPGDPVHWKADVSKLHALGFRDYLSIEEGIKEYVNWIRTLKA